MWGLGKQQKYWLWTGGTDMRRGFDGLSGIVRGQMQERDVLSGDGFVFLNRRRNQMKVLVWESGGFLIYHKRLEAGTFEMPPNHALESGDSLAWESLFFMVEGVVQKGIQHRKRFVFQPNKRLKKD